MKIFNNKPIFKNVTTYDSKIYNNFVKFHNDKFGNKSMYFIILISLLFLYCIIANLISKNLLLALILFAIMVFYLYYKLYVPISNYKKTCKIYSKSNKQVFNFTFYNYFFKINNSKDIFYYFKLHRIIEDKKFFYLYIDNENAVLIDKNGFTLGNSKDFKNFIRKKCFFKYSKV